MLRYPFRAWAVWLLALLVVSAVCWFAVARLGLLPPVPGVVVVLVLGAGARPMRHVIAERLLYRGWRSDDAHLAHVIRLNRRVISDAARLTHVERSDGWGGSAGPRPGRAGARRQHGRGHPARFSDFATTPAGVDFSVRPPVRFGITADSCVSNSSQIDAVIDDLYDGDVAVTVDRVSGAVARVHAVLRDPLAGTAPLDGRLDADAWFEGRP